MNWYKTSQNKILYIVRGVSGSGKSHLAKELSSGGVSFSTDEFFMRGDNYDFDPEKIQEAHSWNQDRSEKAMKAGISPIVIDNTNLQFWQMKPYVELGLKYGYDIKFEEPDWHPDLKNKDGKWNIDFLRGKNIHEVPDDMLEEMIDSYEYNPNIQDILKSKKQVDWE